jgi:YD repeat-containing protein
MKKLLILSVILIVPLLCYSQQSTVIISEVLYDTPLNEATGSENAHDGEFVSLYNYDSLPVDISGWRIEATSINTATSPSYSCFFPAKTVLYPYSLAVVAFRAEGSTFRVDSFYNSFITDIWDMGFYQNSMILPNTRTHLKIYDTNNILQDELIYDGDNAAPAGETLLRAKNGLNLTRAGNLSVSLQRKNITISNDQHIFNRSDYSSGTRNYVRLFEFNTDSTLSLKTESGIKKLGPSSNNNKNFPIEVIPESVLGLLPPSPDAASLGKYGDHPVSLSTGLVDISIPLFEIGTKRIKLPISISYHSSGIKVDEIASSVGLGWALNAGGCVAVTVRNNSDAIGSGFNWVHTADSLNKMTEDDRASFIYNNVETYLPKSECMNNKESDIYSYNFNGYSGQFYYNNKGEIVKLNQDGLKIEDNGGYIITTQDGIQYTFNKIESSRISHIGSFGESSTYSCNNGANSSSAYYLSSIKDLMSNEEIIFHYKNMGKSISDYPMFNGMQKVKPLLGGSYSEPYFDIPRIDFTSIKTDNISALEEIIFPGGRLKITNVENASEETKDVRLFYVSDIKLYSNNSTSDAVKTVKFNHDYFISNIERDTRKAHRLRLDGITINGDQNYQFKYNNEQLPPYFESDANIRIGYLTSSSINCFSQDEWGYYNGEINRTLFKYYPDVSAGITPPDGGDDGGGNNGGWNGNGNGEMIAFEYIHDRISTFPYVPVNAPASPGPSGSSSKRNYYQADRSSNETYMKACSLEEIIYPTGGKTRFEFEGNKFGNTVVGGLRIKSIINYIDGKPIKKIYYDYSSGIMPPLYESYREWEYEQVYGFTYTYSSEKFTPGVSICCPVIKALRCYNTSPLVSNRYSNGNVVYYETVTETVYDGDSLPQEMNVYTYDIGADIEDKNETIYSDGNNIYFGYPVARTYNMGNLLELEHKIYNANTNKFDPRRKVTNTYTTYGKKKEIVGTIIRPQIIYFTQECSSFSPEPHSYECLDIKAESGVKKLTQSITKDYLDDNSTQTNEIIYNYDTTHYLLNKETRRISDGRDIITETTYPFDYKFAPYTNMSLKNMQNFPVESVTKTGGNVTRASVTKYESNTDLIYASSRYSLNTANPFSDYQPSNKNFWSLDNRLSEEESYTYYPNGNIKEIINKRSGVATTVVWGYNDQYPILLIENANYNTVASHISSVTLNSNNPSDTEIFNLRNLIRSNLGNLSPITTNTYEPLKGIKSSTTPNGITTYFEYDKSARLSGKYIIENGTKKYLQKYEYNYAK